MALTVPSVDVLKNTLYEAILREKVAEGRELWTTYTLTDRLSEEDRDALFEVKLDSKGHLSEFLRLAEELGMEVDLLELNQKATEWDTLEEGMTVREVLTRAKRHDESCREFYGQLSDALQNSELEGFEAEEAARVFREVAEEEEEHVRKLEELLEHPGLLLGKRLI